MGSPAKSASHACGSGSTSRNTAFQPGLSPMTCVVHCAQAGGKTPSETTAAMMQNLRDFMRCVGLGGVRSGLVFDFDEIEILRARQRGRVQEFVERRSAGETALHDLIIRDRAEQLC